MLHQWTVVRETDRRWKSRRNVLEAECKVCGFKKTYIPEAVDPKFHSRHYKYVDKFGNVSRGRIPFACATPPPSIW